MISIFVFVFVPCSVFVLFGRLIGLYCCFSLDCCWC
jgi:hypothetical protein